ncbi:MAG: hypothetical protein O3A00_05105, partial [Planctomycetota bacterium]|nr:hypothetical protein [Planctomycetota bacterium]
MQPHPLRFLLAGIAAILVSPSGCSNKSESATDTGTKSLDAKSAVVQPNDNPSPSPPPRRAAESPDAAVQRLIDEIVVGKADVVWDSL